MKGTYNADYFNLSCVIFSILKRNGLYCLITCKEARTDPRGGKGPLLYDRNNNGIKNVLKYLR